MRQAILDNYCKVHGGLVDVMEAVCRAWDWDALGRAGVRFQQETGIASFWHPDGYRESCTLVLSEDGIASHNDLRVDGGDGGWRGLGGNIGYTTIVVRGRGALMIVMGEDGPRTELFRGHASLSRFLRFFEILADEVGMVLDGLRLEDLPENRWGL